MPWWVLPAALGLALVGGGAGLVRGSRRHEPADDRVLTGALLMVVGRLLIGFGVVVVAVVAMLARALA